MAFSRANITVSDDYIITTQSPTKEPFESLGCTIFRYMKKNKDKIAQIDAKTGQTDTYGTLLQRCIRTALHLQDRKVTRDDIITLCTKNHLDSIVPYIATQFLGAKVTSLDISFSPKEMHHLIEQVSPRFIFVTPESVSSIEKFLEDNFSRSEIVVFGETPIHTKFSEFLKPHRDERVYRPLEILNLQDTAVIHFSSGTTGLPKGICLSHYAFIGQALNFGHTDNPDYEYMKSQVGRVTFPLTQLGYTSLYWVSTSITLLNAIVEGFCRLICEDFDGEEVWNLIDKFKPIALVLTPVQVMEMLAKKRDVDVRSVLSIVIIGSPISKKYNLKLQKTFPEADITRGYGQTEVCGILTNFKGNDSFHRPLMKQEEKIESVGLPIRGISYKVVDIETETNLGPNSQGELRIKSNFIMNGYLNSDSSDAFDLDGWLKTGDVVYYDQDYCFYVVDRIREAFKYKGWFIAPTVLENELMNHPAVKRAVVIGIPKEDGCHPMGLVQLNDGFQVTEEEIEKFVEERVPERQRLRAGVRFVDSVELTVTGKIKRRMMRKKILDEMRCT